MLHAVRYNNFCVGRNSRRLALVGQYCGAQYSQISELPKAVEDPVLQPGDVIIVQQPASRETNTMFKFELP